MYILNEHNTTLIFGFRAHLEDHVFKALNADDIDNEHIAMRLRRNRLGNRGFPASRRSLKQNGKFVCDAALLGKFGGFRRGEAFDLGDQPGHLFLLNIDSVVLLDQR